MEVTAARVVDGILVFLALSFTILLVLLGGPVAITATFRSRAGEKCGVFTLVAVRCKVSNRHKQPESATTAVTEQHMSHCLVRIPLQIRCRLHRIQQTWGLRDRLTRELSTYPGIPPTGR